MVRRSSIQVVLVMSGMTLVACGSDDRAKPGDTIRLTFTGKSKSEYSFVLENPTSKAIYFRGTKWFWFAPTPTDTGFDCKNEKTGEAMVGGFPLFDGGKDPPTMEVPPGKAIALRVESRDVTVEKGETCQLHLMLWRPGMRQHQNVVVESQSFQS
jgi:hypothetical protein